MSFKKSLLANNKLFFFILGISLLPIGEIAKHAEYKLALIISLVILSVWLFRALRFASPIAILKDYWNDLKLHQSLASTALLAMLASVLSVILLVVYQPEIVKIPWLEKILTRDSVSIMTFCIGVGITAFQIYRKKFDKILLLGFCSKTITIFTSFMIFGSSLAITPFLFHLSMLSPIIELLVLLILFAIKSDKTGIYLKNVVGLILLGMIISNSFSLMLGWGGSADDIRGALSQVLQITEDAAKGSIETGRLINGETMMTFLIWDRGYDLFVLNSNLEEGFVAENKEWIEATIQNNDDTIYSLDKSYNDSKYALQDFDAQINSIFIKSSGPSLHILNLIKEASDYSQDILELRNKEATTLAYFNEAIITGDTSYYKFSETRSRELLDLTYDKSYDGGDFFKAILLSSEIRNHIDSTIKLINTNSTHTTLSIEFANNSEFQFPAVIHIILLPQCKYYPIDVERDWQSTVLTDAFETKFVKGVNTYHITYKILENHCNYPTERVFIFVNGEIPDEYWPYVSFSFNADLDSK